MSKLTVNIKFIGLKKAIKDIHEYSEKKHRKLLVAVVETSDSVREYAQEFASVDLGEMKREIRSTLIEKRNGDITGDVLSAAEYSSAVEFGTRPHWTGINNIRGWAERHGIPPAVLQRHIALKGTKAHPFMGPAAILNKNKFIKRVKNALRSP
jgi:HK97 gp10 family phage protein